MKLAAVSWTLTYKNINDKYCTSIYSSRSPFKLSYSKKSPPEMAEKLERSLSKSRTRSLKSLHTYEADLAVQAEWDSRHIFERSSAFEYWWGDSKFTTTKPSGRFYTLPMFYHGSRKDCGKVGNVRNGPEKTDGMYSKHSASWAGNMDRAGGEDNIPKNDIIL